MTPRFNLAKAAMPDYSRTISFPRLSNKQKAALQALQYEGRTARIKRTEASLAPYQKLQHF
jgi:hypothetical protein